MIFQTRYPHDKLELLCVVKVLVQPSWPLDDQLRLLEALRPGQGLHNRH